MPTVRNVLMHVIKTTSPALFKEHRMPMHMILSALIPEVTDTRIDLKICKQIAPVFEKLLLEKPLNGMDELVLNQEI